MKKVIVLPSLVLLIYFTTLFVTPFPLDKISPPKEWNEEIAKYKACPEIDGAYESWGVTTQEIRDLSKDKHSIATMWAGENLNIPWPLEYFEIIPDEEKHFSMSFVGFHRASTDALKSGLGSALTDFYCKNSAFVVYSKEVTLPIGILQGLHANPKGDIRETFYLFYQTKNDTLLINQVVEYADYSIMGHFYGHFEPNETYSFWYKFERKS